MLIDAIDHSGNATTIDSARIIKIRSGIASIGDPKDSVLVDFVSGGVFLKGSLQHVTNLFGRHIRLAFLHTPNGYAIRLNADGIAAVTAIPIIDGNPLYSGHSVAVVADGFENKRVIARNKIALSETVTEATAIINSAVLLV